MHSSDNPDSHYAAINLQTGEDQHSYDVVQFGQRQEYRDASAYVTQRDSAEYEDAM